MANNRNAVIEERATYLGLMSLFLSGLTLFNLVKRERNEAELRPFDFIILALATFRLARLTSYDKVAEPLRRPFTKTVPDPSGAGHNVVPRGSGARRALGELFSCPICSGTWIAAGLVYGMNLLPAPTRTLTTIMSVIGLSEILDALTEALSWLGRAERIEAGGNGS